MDDKLKSAVKLHLESMGEDPEIRPNEWYWGKEAALDDAYGNNLCLMQPMDPEQFAKTVAIGIRMWRQSRKEAGIDVQSTN